MYAILFAINLLCLGGSVNIELSSVHWYAPFFSGGGYSQEAFDMMLSLEKVNVTAQIYQHGDGYNEVFVKQMLSHEKRDKLLNFKRPITKASNEHININICHSEPGAWSAPYPKYYTESICPPQRPNVNHFAVNSDPTMTTNRIGGFIMNQGEVEYNIGRTMFETDSIPSGWVDRLNYMNEVWVPTEFSRSIFVAAGVNESKVMVVPVPIDTDFYRPIDIINIMKRTPHREIAQHSGIIQKLLHERIQELSSDEYTTFLFVGKWETRKGIRLLIDAYLNEFFMGDEMPHVRLLLLTSGYHSTLDVTAMLSNMLDEPVYKSIIDGYKKSLQMDKEEAFSGIEVIKNIPQEEMPILYSLVHAVVIPSLGEGWGRPHVEALSCGTAVIATNWSGVTAYLTPDNGYPIEIESELVESK